MGDFDQLIATSVEKNPCTLALSKRSKPDDNTLPPPFYRVFYFLQKNCVNGYAVNFNPQSR